LAILEIVKTGRSVAKRITVPITKVRWRAMASWRAATITSIIETSSIITTEVADHFGYCKLNNYNSKQPLKDLFQNEIKGIGNKNMRVFENIRKYKKLREEIHLHKSHNCNHKHA